MSIRVLLLRTLTLLVSLAGAAGQWPAASAAAATPAWQFAPALAPAPPPGVEPAQYPVPLGPVGDIRFWAPNRGLLITAGNIGETPVPMGVYSYDGVSWHLLSTVCGGTDGRIAWAGPDEFWTISDQRAGQIVSNGSGSLLEDVSLCHFLDGTVVGSYAMPLNQTSSYLPMDAATCLTATNCWFGGGLGVYPNSGSFHLHWDGVSVTVVYDGNPHDDHAISSLAAYKGTLYESVQLSRSDQYGGETPARTPLLHTINVNSPGVFSDVPLRALPSCSGLCPPLPDYGGEEPQALGGLKLSTDAGLSSQPPSQTQMWAVASTPPGGSGAALTVRPIVLRCSSDSSYDAGGELEDCGSDVWAQAPSQLLPAGASVASVAAEPESDSAWLALSSTDGEAHVDHVTLAEHDGQQTATLDQQDALGRGGLLPDTGDRGNARAISCPARNDCWLATDQGWLYHYSDGSQQPRDTDPNFANVITYRPLDAGIPQLIEDTPPPDDSLANQQPPPPPPPTPQVTPTTTARLLSGLHTRLVHRYTLELSFKLIAEAHVQLLATRHGHLVASTPRKTLKAGRAKLLVRLNPHRWPTKLDLRASPLHALPTVPAGSGGSQSSSAPVSSDNVST